jgi:alpha-tubulin suppressor-like RCC1 family protein
VTALVAGLTMATASSAQATPNVAKAWGLNSSGQLGDGTTTGPEKCGPKQNACSTSPVEVTGLAGVTAVAGGSAYSLALLESGSVMAWGNNLHGQLGNGSTTPSDVPVAVKELSEVTAVAAGGQHGLALLKNGTVMAWGSNGFGQLGDGTTTDSHAPVAVKELSGVVGIAAGGEESLAVLENGTVMAWGENSEGQLGNGTKVGSNSPVAVCAAGPQSPCPTGPYLSGVTAVASGSAYSMARLSNGTVMAWGGNTQGELGNGTEAGSDVPVAVCAVGTVGPCPTGPYLTGVKALAAAGFGPNDGGLQSYSVALLENGTVTAWGVNERGELGNGSSTGPEKCNEMLQACSKTPVAVSGLSGVTAIAARGAHTVALLSNTAVKAWGDNKNGQLGDGMSSGPEPCGGIEPTTCSTTPVEVTKLSGVQGIGAGDEHNLAFGPPSAPPSPLPEFGRCVPVKKGTGQYKGAQCLVPAGGKGTYNWLSGPGGKPKFAASAGPVTLETVGGFKVKCSSGDFTGEYTGPKTASVTLALVGCLNGATLQKCQTTPIKEAEIETPPIEAELGFIKGGESPKVGLALKPAPPIAFDCGTFGEETHMLVSVEGSAIGAIQPANSMRSTFKVIYTASKGKQVPERFEGGVTDTLTLQRTVGSTTTTEQAGLTIIGIEEKPKPLIVENEEPIEIKAK